MINQTLNDYFEHSIKENWALPALSNFSNKTTYTYGEVAVEIEKIHILYKEIGLKKGDKIALCGKNGAHWCIIYLATISYGAVLVSILPDFIAKDVAQIVNHSDAKVIFTSHKLWDSLKKEKMPQLEVAMHLSKCTLQDSQDQAELAETIANLPKLFADKYPQGFSPKEVNYPQLSNLELASINYTSGTSGQSKGVMLSGNALAGNIEFAISRHMLLKNQKVLVLLPLAHAFGCAFDFLTSFSQGVHITLLGKIPAPKVLLQAFDEIKPDCIFLVPLILEKIYKKQIVPMINKPIIKTLLKLPFIKNVLEHKINRSISGAFGGNFKDVIVGGAPMNPEVANFLQKIRFPFSVGYGMTECAPLISYTPWAQFKAGSVGKILPKMEVKILSKDPEHINGEILVRGENIMMGYYKNEEETKAAIDSEGWLHTGDLGTLEPDQTIYIKGRSKNMLLSANGQNIFPEGIEAKLENLTCINESVVVQDNNNHLIALVYPDMESIKRRNLQPEAVIKIMKHNKKRLNSMTAKFEQIFEIRLVEQEFKKTPKSSIKRYLYQKEILEQSTAKKGQIVIR